MNYDTPAPLYPSVRRFSYFVEALFILMILFGPWAFGTTQVWSVCTLCITAGVFFLCALILWGLDRYFSSRFLRGGSFEERPRLWGWADWCFVGLGLLCLFYVLIQWVNAQSDYLPGTSEFLDYKHNEHLPSSMDKCSTLYYLLQYTALFCTYLGCRILFQLERERGRLFTPRMERFVWIALASSFAMVIVGSLMRLDETTTLLWIVKREHWGGINNSFVPYGYRSNAAQYMNLIWPIGIAFWWTMRERFERSGLSIIKSYLNKYLVLAIMSLFVLAGVWIAISRGGVWMASIVTVLLGGLITISAFKASRTAILSTVIGFVLVGGTIWFALDIAGKDALRLTDTESQGRLDQYEASWPIYHDYPVYGVGAGAYAAMYDLYAPSDEKFFAMAHSDWLQLIIEFGNVGTTLVCILLLWGILVPWFMRRGTIFLRLAILLAFSTALCHAIVDVPFYVLSVSWLFVVLMAFYHSMGKRSRRKHAA